MKPIKFKNHLVSIEWSLRYTIYTIALAMMFQKLYENIPHTLLYTIWFIVLIILGIALHLDTFYLLAKQMSKGKKITFKVWKLSE